MAQVRKRIAPPLVGSDIILVIRPGQNVNQVLDCTYDQLVQSLQQYFSGGGGGAVDSVNGLTGVVVLALDNLSDVNAGSPTIGQFLQWNGTAWVASTVSPGGVVSVNTQTGVVVLNLNDINNVTAPSPSAGDYLKWNQSTSEWISAPIAVDNGLSVGNAAGDIHFGGGLIKPTVLTLGITTANNRLQYDAPFNTGTGGSFLVTALNPSGSYTSPNNRLAYFNSNDIVTATFQTGNGFTGGGTAVQIISTHSSCTPIVISGNTATGSGEVFKVTDAGQLIMEEYRTPTAFSSGLTSQGILNVDNTGKVFVSPAPTGTGTVISITAGTGLNATASNPILTSGTISLNTKLAPADSIAGNAGKFLRVNSGATAVEYADVASGGGGGRSYYLNGSVIQGTFAGIVDMKEISPVPVIGTGTDFTINTNGYIESFITDAGDPNKAVIPAGNWNFELWFSVNNSGGSPNFYVEISKYDGVAFTLIATGSANPTNITTTVTTLYITALSVPLTTLLLTDRLAVRVFVNHGGGSRVVKLHTQGPHLSQIITDFPSGITSLNGLTAFVQNFATPGTAGTAPYWSSALDTHTLNIPLASTASVTAGLISNTQYSNLKTGSFGVTVDGVTGIVQVGTIGYVVMPYAGNITGWSITANVAGTISFDITEASGAIPTLSIIGVGGNYPTLTSTQFITSTTMTNWTLGFAAGDVFGFSVRASPAPASIKNATLTIRTTRT
jgi:hypothetical protein